MTRFTDEELINEIKKRFDDNKKAVYDLRMLTRKLEDVNKKLMDSESLKSNFISNIKNELNNPLTTVLILSKGLIDKEFDLDQAREIAKTLYSELFNLNFQLTNIFAAAEVEAGESVLSVSNVDVDSLINNTLDFFHHLIEEKNLSVDYMFINKHEQSSFFKTDASKLQLIISNLIANAIEFSEAGSSFEVKVWKHESFLNLIISDRGPGIDDENQSVIFERFKQLDTGVTKRYKGHGLGLSICKTFVELMQGTINVTSKIGMGTIFTLFIPEAKLDSSVNVFSDDGNEFFFEEGEEEKF